MSDFKNILLGALLVAVIVLGYLYYEDRQSTVEINLPNVKVEKR